MNTLLSILLIGFLLGMRHATDCDHVLAVTNMITGERSILRAALTAVYWGLGHGLTVIGFGSAIILLGFIVPPWLGLGLELGAALMLILLGFLNLRTLGSWKTRRHQESPNHPAPIAPPIEQISIRPEARLHPLLGPTAIGVVHGLAGSAAVALLVLPLIQDPRWAFAYLALFGIGTLAGMVLITALIAIPARYAGDHFLAFERYATATTGLLSVGLGSFLFWHIGFVEGLFIR